MLGDKASSQTLQPSASQGSFVDRSFSYTNDIKTIADIMILQDVSILVPMLQFLSRRNVTIFYDVSFIFTQLQVSNHITCHVYLQQAFCNTFGTTKRFKSSRCGWYYEQCPACNRTNKFPGQPFICTCCENTPPPLTKYKIEIEVENDCTTDCFVFWDKECIQYVGMAAHALREIMKKSNEDHP
ncbi:unnamed protein product [Lathyrus sativus]|nr:unnamed protein product [Lathyrus sativus]